MLGAVAGAGVGEAIGGDGAVGPPDSEDFGQLQSLFKKNGRTMATTPKQMMMIIPNMMTVNRREAVRGSTVGGGVLRLEERPL